MNKVGRPFTSRLMRSRFVRFLGRLSQSRKFAISLVAAALISVLATYLAMTGTAPLRPEPRLILLLLNIDLILVLALVTILSSAPPAII